MPNIAISSERPKTSFYLEKSTPKRREPRPETAVAIIVAEKPSFVSFLGFIFFKYYEKKQCSEYVITQTSLTHLEQWGGSPQIPTGSHCLVDI